MTTVGAAGIDVVRRQDVDRAADDRGEERIAGGSGSLDEGGAETRQNLALSGLGQYALRCGHGDGHLLSFSWCHMALHLLLAMFRIDCYDIRERRVNRFRIDRYG
ncbi:hypothetical protein NLY43_29100 [Mesorhizobium sp. C416B]|uniref:hypothetical protein n=1 Tax=unclassified Mesorhizobium TaxID=325217 RepID=UPI001FD945BB|nr:MULTISPECIES: hypothetical protein [unclassified Mesorhizobium]WJI62597.1 hypothetical protein NLY43_29100 [Mesorhizobium sp. C416B]